MPIVGSRTTQGGTLTSSSGGNLKTSTIQVPPYVNGVPFNSCKIRPAVDMKSGGSPNTFVFSAGLDLNTPWDDMGIVSFNRARARLMEKLTPSRAAMAVNLAQLNQSLEMIAGRAKQLTTAYRHLRRGNILAFARTLKLQPYKRHLRDTNWRNNVSGTWLEYTFGWSPLISDMYNAADVLQSEFAQLEPAHGVGVDRRIIVHDRTYEKVTVMKRYKVICTANIRVDNPNLALANQLGLVNPAAVVWDIIPFSFVIDWFLKINQYVNTLNDMAGFSFVNPSTTRIITAEVDVYSKWFRDTGSSGGRRVMRDHGIPPPTFNPKFQLPMPSLWLAATSTSLLYQVFGGRK